MAISKDLVVTIKKDKAKPEDKMFIYRNDNNIDVYIEISNLGYTISKSNEPFIASAKAFYKTPGGTVIQYPRPLEIVNGKKIKFSFTEEITPTMQEIGEYELQFQLFDNTGGRITVPSYYFYVKEPMGQTSINDNAIVGLAIVGDSLLPMSDDDEILFVMEDGYIKTTWVNGDLITANRLNNMENGIHTAIEEINHIKENGSGIEEECIYSSDVPSTVAVGGIPLNYTTTGITFNDFIYDLLHPYVKPTITLSVSPTTVVYEQGYTIPKLTFTANAKRGSKSITQIAINKNDVVVELSDFNEGYMGNPNLCHLVDNVKTPIKIYAYATDGDNRVNSNTINISFINPIYIGVVDSDKPTQTQIKAMTKRVVNPSNQSYNFTMLNKRMCISTPNNWAIKTIVDQNGFDITNSFTTINVNITCLDGVTRAYKTYISNVNTQNNFTVKFNI